MKPISAIDVMLQEVRLVSLVLDMLPQLGVTQFLDT